MAQNQIGSFIAVLRKSMGLSQQEIADKLNVSNKTISRWETGESLPDILAIPALAEIFGVTADEILTGERVRSEHLPINQTEQKRFILNQSLEREKQFFIVGSALSLIGVGLLILLLQWNTHLALGLSLSFIGLGMATIVIASLKGEQVVKDSQAQLSKQLALGYISEHVAIIRRGAVITAFSSVFFSFVFMGNLFPFSLVDRFGLRWLGPSMILGFLAGVVSQKVMENHYQLPSSQPLNPKLVLVGLLALMVGSFVVYYFSPTHTVTVTDPYAMTTVADNLSRYRAGKEPLNVYIPVEPTEEANWLDKDSSSSNFTSGLSLVRSLSEGVGIDLSSSRSAQIASQIISRLADSQVMSSATMSEKPKQINVDNSLVTKIIPQRQQIRFRLPYETERYLSNYLFFASTIFGLVLVLSSEKRM